MMQRPVAIGLLLATLPSVAFAQPAPPQSTFDLFYSETENETKEADLPPAMTQFVIDQMRYWHGDGIVLTKDDIDAAIHGRYWTPEGDGLCQGKQKLSGESYDFLQGGDDTPASCTALGVDIATLINREREINGLATDLLGIAGGAETSIADEPSHAVDMAGMAMVLRRVWSGTGSAVIPWDGSADTQFHDLDGVLSGLSEEDLDKAIIRFRHGFFRDQREADPRFSGVADDVHDKLSDLAGALGITGDPSITGIFAVPKPTTPNVAVWIRKDDLGLLYVYPTHYPRFRYIEAGGAYPEEKSGSGTLAYPYEYEGSTPSSGPLFDSPLCSRLVGQQGYLCRPVPDPDTNCPPPGSSDKITLVKCEERTFSTTRGPNVCPEFRRIYDNDPNLTDPTDPAKINPALVLADTGSICTPENKVVYQDDIASHACYVGYCLRQSMSGHTLVPNRNPVLITEATSPFLACIRSDPQLGLYTETVQQSPYPLPEYLGPFLVRDFERQYCETTGNPPQALAGFCGYDDNENAARPQYLNSMTALKAVGEQNAVAYRQGIQNLSAMITGQRAVTDQSIDVYRKVFAKLANFIQQTANLLTELKNAPLTTVACPWTGQFKSSVPSP